MPDMQKRPEDSLFYQQGAQNPLDPNSPLMTGESPYQFQRSETAPALQPPMGNQAKLYATAQATNPDRGTGFFKSLQDWLKTQKPGT